MASQLFTLAELQAFLEARRYPAINKSQLGLRVIEAYKRGPRRVAGASGAMLKLYHITRDAAFRSIVNHVHSAATLSRASGAVRSANTLACKMADEKITPYLAYRLKITLPPNYFLHNPTAWTNFRKQLIVAGHSQFTIAASAAVVEAELKIAG